MRKAEIRTLYDRIFENKCEYALNIFEFYLLEKIDTYMHLITPY